MPLVFYVVHVKVSEKKLEKVKHCFQAQVGIERKREKENMHTEAYPYYKT